MNDGMRHESQFRSQLQQVRGYLGAITTATVCVFVLMCVSLCVGVAWVSDIFGGYMQFESGCVC